MPRDTPIHRFAIWWVYDNDLTAADFISLSPALMSEIQSVEEQAKLNDEISKTEKSMRGSL